MSNGKDKGFVKDEDVSNENSYSDVNISDELLNAQIDSFLQEFGNIAQKPIDAIAYPQIDPVIFELGPLAIRWYSLAYLVGIVFGWFYIKYLNANFQKEKISSAAYDSIPLCMVISIILGGRIGYVLFYNFDYYSANILEAFHIWKGGMSFHGGVIGVIVGVLVFCKIYKVKFYTLMDCVAAAAPVGLLLGRIANFVNAELRGKPTDWKYGVLYPGETFARHASQLYEAVLEGVVLFALLYFLIKKFDMLEKPGRISGWFLMGYGASRFFVEFFREPDVQIGYLFSSTWFTMGQLLCLPMFVVGSYLVSVKFANDKRK